MYETFNRKVIQLIESGLATKYINEDEINNAELRVEPPGLQVLTMNHLEFGFQIWLAFLAIALLVFLLEFLLG